MSDLNPIQLLIVLIVASAGLSFVMLALALLVKQHARRTFFKCSAAAKSAGVEDAFMSKFNAIAQYGDSLDSVIARWGARRIQRMYADSIKSTM